MTAETQSVLTDADQERFDLLDRLLLGVFAPRTVPALMRARLHGRDVAVVVAITEQPHDGMVRADPVAVLIDEPLLEQLTPPGDVEVMDERVG